MKGIDHAIRKASAELNIPEDKARVVIMEYWDNVYKKIIGGDSTSITVRHLGTFTMSRYKLNNFIVKKIRSIKKVRATKKFTEKKREDTLLNIYKLLRKALIRRNEIAEQYAKKI